MPDKPSQEDPENPGQSVDCRLKVAVKEDTKNIFEMMEFSLYNDTDHDISIADLRIAYDSITWQINGQQGHLRIFEHKPGAWRLSSGWGHCFYLPGTYETCLVGYKNNKVVYSDTLQVEVSDRKDFLGYDWDEVADSGYSIGYVNILNQNKSLQAYTKIRDGVPSVELRFSYSESDDGNALLYDYINSLYGEPAYDRNSSELAAKYEELFSYRKNGATPHAIWLTDKARIILLNRGEDLRDWYWVYAEPRL